MKSRELRLLLTQKCNFKCNFCHKEGVTSIKKELLDYQDYLFIYQTLKRLYGWETVSITGGEPLCRPEIKQILENLYKDNAKITLITNGSLLNKNIEICQWLNRITISVHTMDSDKYKEIIGTSFELNKLISNLIEVRNQNPTTNIRFNCTIVKGINDKEQDILKIINFAENLGASIKFIELLPNSKEDENNFVSIDEIEKILFKQNYNLIETSPLQKIYSNGNTTIVLARIVCSISKQLGTAYPHCTTTNSLFLAADGTIKPCMRNDFEINMLQEIKDRDIEGIENKLGIFFEKVSNLCPFESEKTALEQKSIIKRKVKKLGQS